MNLQVLKAECSYFSPNGPGVLFVLPLHVFHQEGCFKKKNL